MQVQVIQNKKKKNCSTQSFLFEAILFGLKWLIIAQMLSISSATTHAIAVFCLRDSLRQTKINYEPSIIEFNE